MSDHFSMFPVLKLQQKPSIFSRTAVQNAWGWLAHPHPRVERLYLHGTAGGWLGLSLGLSMDCQKWRIFHGIFHIELLVYWQVNEHSPIFWENEPNIIHHCNLVVFIHGIIRPNLWRCSPSCKTYRVYIAACFPKHCPIQFQKKDGPYATD